MLRCCRGRWRERGRGLWNPMLLNPSIYIKANANNSITMSGADVSSVVDLASKISFSGSGPIKVDRTQLGNRQTLRIDNKTTKSYLTASYSYTGNEITLVSLHRNKSAAGLVQYGRLWSLYRPTAPDYNQTDGGILTYSLTGFNGVTFYRALSLNVSTSPLINDTWGCVILTRSGTSVTMSLDGGARVTGSTNAANFNFTTLRIGNDDGPRDDSGMDGYIAENMIINRAISKKEEDLLYGYMAWEWGRQITLSDKHPFRLRQPLVGD